MAWGNSVKIANVILVQGQSTLLERDKTKKAKLFKLGFHLEMQSDSVFRSKSLRTSENVTIH